MRTDEASLGGGRSAADVASPAPQPQRPHSARVWNRLLGGKNCYLLDTAMADLLMDTLPSARTSARQAELFRVRAVGVLANSGISQFLEVGVGFPSPAGDDTHQIAQRISPAARVVYIDNDPLVTVHAAALLTSRPPGLSAAFQSDLMDPDAILAQAADVLDLGQPVALILVSVLQHIQHDIDMVRVVGHLTQALAPGSDLVLSHPTDAVARHAARQAMSLWNTGGATPPVMLRSAHRLARLFEGLEILDPGIVSCSLWRPDHSPFGEPERVTEFGAVAQVPPRPHHPCDPAARHPITAPAKDRLP